MQARQPLEEQSARFWIYEHDDYVRLTLKPGDSYTYSTGGATDEGSHYEGTTWTREGEYVNRFYGSYGRDCDGYMETSGEDRCHLSQLRAGFQPSAHGETDDTEVRLPVWSDQQSGPVYDESARRMNY
jgi:hypothetical protein